MALEKRPKEYRCRKCSKTLTSMLRLQHHWAAEHALKTLRDIKTFWDIHHSTGRMS